MAESPSESDATEASAESPQDLVEDVLREAQALLDAPDAGNPEAALVADDPAPASESSEAVDVEGLVARVDSLLGDLGHLVEDVESVEDSVAAAGLDLTLVLPKTSPSPDDVIPDHGSAGPQVDLFATPEEPQAAPEVISPESEVVLETEASSEIESPTSTSDETAMLDDLTTALAEEFSQATDEASSEEEVGTPTSDIVSETEDALLDAMAEEFGREPTELPPLEDEGDPFASSSTPSAEPSDAARRLEALLANRLAEEFEMVEKAATTTPKVIESQVEKVEEVQLAQSDVDAVARAEMEALEALGSHIDTEVDLPDRQEHLEDPGEPSIDSIETVRQSESSVAVDEEFAAEGDETTANEAIESTTSSDEPAVAAETCEEIAEDGIEFEDSTEIVPGVAESSTDTETVEASDGVTETVVTIESRNDRPKPGNAGSSALVRFGAAPFRFVPKSLHRHATPVALSLVAWVPLAWGFAILAPDPEPPKIEVLRTGFDVDETDGAPIENGGPSGPTEQHDSSSRISSTVDSGFDSQTVDSDHRVRH